MTGAGAFTDAPEVDPADLGFEPPVSLDSPPVPPLPQGALSGWLGDMVKAVSESTETPPELAALMGLAVLGAACQKTFTVRPEPGYFEPLNLWTVAALPSGNRKSAVLNAMTRPLVEWEEARNESEAPRVQDAESRRKTLEARITHIRGEAARAKERTQAEALAREVADLEAQLPDVPKVPKVWVQDVTPERLGALMADHGERMAVLSAEGGIFDILAGRYNGGLPNLDLFLQGHSGDPVRVDRGSRPPVHLRHPALTIGLSPQPDLLRGLAEKPGFRGRGLLARFLYALPASPLGYRTLEAQPVPQATADAYRRGVVGLLETPPATGDDGNPRPHVLTFSGGAWREWKDFQRTVEHGMREGGRFEHATDWAGKAPGAAARLAGLLHCQEVPQPWGAEVSGATMGRTLELAAVLSAHALAVFDLMGADPSLDAARKLWRWVERTRARLFTARDAFKALQGSIPRMEGMNQALAVLLERGYIRELPRVTGPGRPSRSFTVNPLAAAGWR